jgi:hypothetical protein
MAAPAPAARTASTAITGNSQREAEPGVARANTVTAAAAAENTAKADAPALAARAMGRRREIVVEVAARVNAAIAAAPHQVRSSSKPMAEDARTKLEMTVMTTQLAGPGRRNHAGKPIATAATSATADKMSKPRSNRQLAHTARSIKK